MISYLWSKLIKKIRGNSIINCKIHYTSKAESGSSLVNVDMDRYSFCGYDCTIINAKIGSFCSIANNVIIGGAMHPIEWVSTSPVFYKGRDSVKAKFSEHIRANDKITKIGNDVWIGNNAIIKQGLTIGTGSVIGMGSVVTKNVDPYSIVAGNPAKFIRYRFDDCLRQKLLLSEWWNLNEKALQSLGPFSTDPVVFLTELESLKEIR